MNVDLFDTEALKPLPVGVSSLTRTRPDIVNRLVVEMVEYLNVKNPYDVTNSKAIKPKVLWDDYSKQAWLLRTLLPLEIKMAEQLFTLTIRRWVELAKEKYESKST